MAGTLLFAVEGATAAIRGNLDQLGLMVLAFAVALGGGIIRDLLIGAVPPPHCATGATAQSPSPARFSPFSSITPLKDFLPPR